MARNATKPISAEETTYDRMLLINQEIARIERLTTDLYCRQDRDPGNWGISGDLGRILIALKEIK